MSTPNRAKPGWLRNAPLQAALMPEPPLLQKYRGTAGSDADQRCAAALSDITLDGLARGGVNFVWLHFFAGFGLEFEKAEMERARTFIAAAHTRGMKAAAILQLGALTPETLQLEENDCQNWLQINSEGQTVPLESAQFFRVRPCFASEGFLRYMERACSAAADFGADLIHLENAAYNAEPDTCRCAICVAAFREFLRQRYGAQDDRTRAAGLARFGHNTFTHVRPPVFQNAASVASEQAAQSPHVQEWTEYKAQTLGQCLARLAQGIGKRNPDCAISADLLRGFSPGGGEGALGIHFETQLPLLDVATGRLSGESGDSAEHLRIARLFGLGTCSNARSTDVDGQSYPLFDVTF